VTPEASWPPAAAGVALTLFKGIPKALLGLKVLCTPLFGVKGGSLSGDKIGLILGKFFEFPLTC